MLASQLFGHRRGAFTGATADQKGLFEEAHRGTIFWDEIGEIPPALSSAVDVRVLAATNRDLPRAIAEGRFREDLYYRICVARARSSRRRCASTAKTPRSSRRSSSNRLWSQSAGARGRSATRRAERLMSHDSPGNVRELKSPIEVAVINGQERCDSNRRPAADRDRRQLVFSCAEPGFQTAPATGA